jgi:hypothetical protein
MMYRRNHMQSVGYRTSIVAYSEVGVPGCRRADLGVAGLVHRFVSSYSVFCGNMNEGLLGKKKISLKTSLRFIRVQLSITKKNFR